MKDAYTLTQHLKMYKDAGSRERWSGDRTKLLRFRPTGSGGGPKTLVVLVTSIVLWLPARHIAQVDVGQAKGQQMMDAGLVAFETSSGLDLRKSQGFRDGGKTYCVAPITNGQVWTVAAASAQTSDVASTTSRGRTRASGG
ncbi:Uncharacterized protein SCF082_LOCUS52250 [Durusdinium trenchii]|uniref:Uncharacterized protein n=1 Tax=Durusdinium trenchii TaxID=1381693 RepID=A0ABP0SJY3_9DINO